MTHTQKPCRVISWDDEYSFRIYPPKFDLKWANILPDPSTVKIGEYWITYETDFFDFMLEQDPSSISTSSYKQVVFRKVSMGYEYKDHIVYIQDWEEV